MLCYNEEQIEKIKLINKSPGKIYLTTAGGGQSFFHHFMSISGSSNTIAGGNIPYSKEHLIDFCKQSINKFCCSDTALLLAVQSYKLGLLADNDILGIGITSSLSYDNERPNREHYSYIAIHSYDYSLTCNIKFFQNTTRAEQEFAISEILLDLLYKLFLKYIPINITHSNAIVELDCIKRSDFMELTDIPLTESRIVLFPGSFNPYHTGHAEMVKLAEEKTNLTVIHEITTHNADKGMLNYFEIKKRINSIHDLNPNAVVVISNESTIVGKIHTIKNPDRYFYVIVGSDTWTRIANPIYGYDRQQLLDFFINNNTRFIVFNRVEYPFQIDEEDKSDMHQLVMKFDEALEFNNPQSSTNIRILKEEK